MDSKRIDQLKKELEKIRIANGGRLTRQAVVKAARKAKGSVLHSMFDWNVDKAAERHWLDRAQEIITRYVTVTVIHRARKITSVFYVSDPRAKKNDGGYVAINQKDIQRNDAIQIVLNEVDRCKSSIERARNVADVLDSKFPGTAAQLQQMLEQLIALGEALQAA